MRVEVIETLKEEFGVGVTDLIFNNYQIFIDIVKMKNAKIVKELKRIFGPVIIPPSERAKIVNFVLFESKDPFGDFEETLKELNSSYSLWLKNDVRPFIHEFIKTNDENNVISFIKYFIRSMLGMLN